MRITLKLYAGLGEFLPPGARDNATEVEIVAGASLQEIIDRFHVPRERAHLVLVNGVYVNRSERDARVLTDGDVLAVWPPVAGG
ncbi:MAG: MoaD/ThiS family protein [Gammaproteobacteria bacterium]|nr:MoaD/ThiS family protein [Gammaproteobacteria bacterium]